MQLHAFE